MSDGVALLLVLASVVLNAFFAGVETGFTSARRVRLVHWAREGRIGAQWAARLAEHRESTIVSAVVGNNVAIVAGTGVATALAVNTFGAEGETIAGICMAAVNIVFGEILPKTAYRANPEPLVTVSALPFVVLAWLLTPVRWVAVQSSRGLLWLLGVREVAVELALTRERLAQHFALSRSTAGLDPHENRLLQDFIEHSRRPVESVATPFARVATVSLDSTVRDVLDRVRETGHSRLPVLGLDQELVGLVLFRDLPALSGNTPIRPFVRDAVGVPAGMGLDEAIGVLTERQVSIAVVESCEGRPVGVVTLEDLLEPLVGDILDEHDPPKNPTALRTAGSAALPGA